LREHFADEFVKEDIGYLVSNVDIPNWIATVRKRYVFLEALDDDERQWARCNPRNRYSVTQALAGFK
jgi:hypothetical protein